VRGDVPVVQKTIAILWLLARWLMERTVEIVVPE